MTANSHFPWYFFWRTVRINAVVGLLIFIALWTIDSRVAWLTLPWMMGGFLVTSYLFYRATRPLERVLNRVTRIVSHELPHRTKIDLFYRKDEWANIEAALIEADERLDAQLKTIQAENLKFTTLLGSINNEILAVDRQANVLFFNPRFERTFISGKAKLQSGGKLWSILDVPEAREVFEDVLSNDKMKKLKGFVVIVGEDTRYYNLTVSPLPGEDGEHNGAVGVFTDVTEAKLTEQMRVDFVANVSHEIRTPLTSIKGFTQVLKANKQTFPNELQGFIEKILHNTERMIALFNDLLELSVIESRDRMKIEPTSLSEMLDHVEANVKAVHHGKTIQVDRELQINKLNVDPKLFEQVLTNLIENACKYGGASPIIKVTTTQKDKQIKLTIADNGPGIAKEHLPRIFERFYRVDASRDRETGGTGLGLAIVKHIVVKHHGTIHAESDGACGTRFVINLNT